MRLHPCVAGLLVLLAAGCSGSGGGDEETATATETQVVTRSVGGGGGATFAEIPDVVDRVQPSVVSIATDTGEGSGVIWSDDGLVVTNQHVIVGAQTVEVVLASGAELEAEVEASTADFDLAVLRVQGEGLPEATFADALPRVGELAIAMGNPLGLQESVTAGIVSGLHRSVPSGGQTPALVDLIQTDAAISPGNSGGALVNGTGEVIGVNVAYVPPERGAVALGFAIPAPTVSDVVRQLLETGRVEQAYLGVTNPVQVTPELAQSFGLEVEEGVTFVSVVEGTPAARAGLEPGDVIVALDEQKIESVEDLFAQLRRKRPGQRIAVEFFRGGDRREVSLELAARPDG